MTKKIIPRGAAPQDNNVASYLDTALRRGRALSKALILNRCPDEEPLPPKTEMLVQEKGAGWVLGVRERFTAADFKKMRRFPGYIPGYHQREQMKYGRCPLENAPIEDWIWQYLNHAKAKWSGAVDGGETRQFADWLPVYMGDDRFRWTTGPDGYLKAEQLVRLAWGLPRFRATKPKKYW